MLSKNRVDIQERQITNSRRAQVFTRHFAPTDRPTLRIVWPTTTRECSPLTYINVLHKFQCLSPPGTVNPNVLDGSLVDDLYDKLLIAQAEFDGEMRGSENGMLV